MEHTFIKFEKDQYCTTKRIINLRHLVGLVQTEDNLNATKVITSNDMNFCVDIHIDKLEEEIMYIAKRS